MSVNNVEIDAWRPGKETAGGVGGVFEKLEAGHRVWNRYMLFTHTYTHLEKSDCLDYMGATVKHNQSGALKGPMVQ